MTSNRNPFSTRRSNSQMRARRRGVVIYYMTAVMVALCGICSLAVDLGRVQLVKTELRRAADSAARAAVAAVPADFTEARNLASSYAQMNRADGVPVELNFSEDLEFGRWDAATQTFTVLNGADRSRANAVRVTARRTAARGNATPLIFGRLVGKQACDTVATAVAFLAPPKPMMNVVGIESIRINGNDRIDSYNSTLGGYSTQSSGGNVNIGTNGSLQITGSSVVNGDVYYGNGSAPTGPITGDVQQLEESLNYPPPTLPATYKSHGAISLNGGQSLTLTAGNHYCTSLYMGGSATLKVTGPVNLYVQGAFTMDGNSTITVAGSTATNLKIYVLGSSPVNLGKNNLYAAVYAPLSDLIMNGNADLFGSVVAKNIRMNGNNTIHYDEALNGEPGPGRILLVK